MNKIKEFLVKNKLALAISLLIIILCLLLLAKLGAFKAVGWDGIATTPVGGIQNVSEDTSPTLGGPLDAGGYNITGIGNLTAIITTSTKLNVLTEMSIPTSTNPTVDRIGELAWDSTKNSIKIYGAAEHSYPKDYSIGFNYSTSTAWTGTTTVRLAPAAESITYREIYCETDTGTLNVSLYDGTNRADMLNASTTIGLFQYGTNNTFTKAESQRVDVGTPADSPTTIACRLKFIYDP